MSASQVLQMVCKKLNLIWYIYLACWISERGMTCEHFALGTKRQIQDWCQKLGANCPYSVTHRLSIFLNLNFTSEDSCWRCDIFFPCFSGHKLIPSGRCSGGVHCITWPYFLQFALGKGLYSFVLFPFDVTVLPACCCWQLPLWQTCSRNYATTKSIMYPNREQN